MPYPNEDLQSTFAATADGQVASAFFNVLPPEVRRMIYVEFWRLSGLKQHILRRSTDGSYARSSCLVADQNAADGRFPRFQACSEPPYSNGLQSIDLWAKRIESDWAVHWECEELRETKLRGLKRGTLQEPLWSPFMPALLTCKLMYLECIESLYSTLTFVFTNTDTAEAFISAHPPSAFRSIELCIRASPILPELYSPRASEQGPLPTLPGQPPVNAQNNPWARLCTSLIRCSALRQLEIWFDVKDLRPWQDRVYEIRFFAALFNVKTSGGGQGGESFILALPHVEREKRAFERRRRLEGVEESYLEGDSLAGAPFVVKRAPRPNYWQTHLARVRFRDRIRAVLTIDAGPPAAGT